MTDATDADFELATKSGAESGAQVAQNAAQHAHAGNRNVSQETTQAPDESRAYAVCCDNVRDSAQTFSGEDRIRTCGPVARSPI